MSKKGSLTEVLLTSATNLPQKSVISPVLEATQVKETLREGLLNRGLRGSTGHVISKGLQ